MPENEIIPLPLRFLRLQGTVASCRCSQCNGKVEFKSSRLDQGFFDGWKDYHLNSTKCNVAMVLDNIHTDLQIIFNMAVEGEKRSCFQLSKLIENVLVKERTSLPTIFHK